MKATTTQKTLATTLILAGLLSGGDSQALMR